jgi:hypothetical protein
VPAAPVAPAGPALPASPVTPLHAAIESTAVHAASFAIQGLTADAHCMFESFPERSPKDRSSTP